MIITCRKKGDLIRHFFISILILALIFTSQVSAAGEDYSGDKITIVTDDNYPPFSFRDSEGNLQGVLIDQWDLWEEKTGIEAEITGMSWGEAQRLFEAGEFDVLETPMYTPERAGKYEFSNPYAEIEAAIYFNNRISGISGPESLRGFVVAVKSGDASYNYLIGQGLDNFVEYDSYEDIVIAAKEGDVVVFSMDSPQADFFLYKYGIQDKFSRTEPLYSGEVHRAVLKENAVLVDTIDSGFDSISEVEYSSIDRKWYGIPWMPEGDLRVLFVFIGIILICTLLLAVWNHVLKLRVREKTSELLNEVESGKRKAEQLFESEQRFRELFDNINDAVVLVSAEQALEKGDIISVNRAACRMLGYTEGELMKLTLPGIQAEEGREDPGKVTDILKKSENVVVETEFLRKDGSKFPVEVSLHRFTLGEKLVVLAVARDISERVEALQKLAESEMRYRSVVEDQTEFICRFNTEMELEFANTAFCRYFGIKKEDVKGRTIGSLIYPDDLYRVGKHIRSLTPEKPVASIEQRIILPNGEVRWQLWSDRAVYDENGEFVEYQAVGRDVTEARQKDEAIALAARKLNILNSVTFTEIQNYLFCQQGYLQLAIDLSESGKQKDYLEKQSESMTKIAETLRFAKNYQDLGISPPQWYDFEKTFIFAMSHTNTAELEKDLNLSGVLIFADNLLEKALSDMISGLLSYNTECRKISLGYEMEGEMLKIIFETDGRGIPGEAKEAVFTRGGDRETGIDIFLIEEVLSVTNISIKETGDPGKGIRIGIFVPPGKFRIEDESSAR